MAFQVGSQVRPELLDYSGYAQGMTNAANITAASLTDLGASIGNAIEKHKENKQKKQTTEYMANLIKGDPTIRGTLGLGADADDAEFNIAAKQAYDILGKDASRLIVAQDMFPTLFDDDDDVELGDIEKLTDSIQDGFLKDRYKIDRKTGKIINRDTNEVVTPGLGTDQISDLPELDKYYKFLQNPKNILGLDFSIK